MKLSKQKKLSPSTRLDLYKKLLYPRMIEEKMLSLLRQGRISKWFSGIGQEAISVGCSMGLHAEDTICTMHRNLGVFTSRGVPLQRLFAQWQGTAGGFTKGRDRSFHFGAPEYNLVGMISHLGPQLSVACGIALAEKNQGNNKIALAFTGEGGTSQGEFHEALNVAAVWKLPVIFIIENNGYGLSTPTSEQYSCEHLADRATGYGMKSSIIDGNNVEEVYRTIQGLAKKIRKNPQPWLVECKTFRMRGHEEASGTKYVPEKLMEKWASKDPVSTYEKQLKKEGIINDALISKFKTEFKDKINAEIKEAEKEKPIQSGPAQEFKDVYAPNTSALISPTTSVQEMRFVDAVSSGINESMTKHDQLVIMGQDIAEYGGVFKVTEGMVEKYGKERVRNTPLCESAIVGTCLGLSIRGIKSIMEMQFADFVTCGFNQIVNNLAKVHYRWGQNADVVIRMPTGGGVGAGPFHSQSNEAWFFHVPGLKIVYPSNPQDAKGLLIAAVDDPNPVLFFEHKALYRKLTGSVPSGYYHTEIGKAQIVREGKKASIITYGMGVHWALEVTQKNNWDIEVLDLRTLLPLDYEAIDRSVRKTNKVLILHEDTLTGGIGGDISAYISENLFQHIDAPIMRVGSMDTPVPFAVTLENNFLANNQLEEKLKALMQY